MRLDTIGTMIACRELSVRGQIAVTVKLGKPEPFRDGRDYYCPYQIVGLGDERVRYAGGIDGVQALGLALRAIGAELYASREAASGLLAWEGGENPRDLGFPVPETLRDLAPAGGPQSLSAASHREARAMNDPDRTEDTHDHLVCWDLQGRTVSIDRVHRDGSRGLFTRLPVPARDPASTEIGAFATRLGEALLIDSPAARRLLKL